MNNNTNNWAVEIKTDDDLVAVEKIAAKYGYKPFSGLPSYVESVIFHPNTKSYVYESDIETIKSYVCKIVSSFVDVLTNLETPPQVKFEANNDFLGVVEKYPQVLFNYIKKGEFKSKDRNLLVVAKTDEYIEGFDMNDNFKFKRFLLENIAGEIVFMGFAEKKNEIFD